MIRSYLVIGRLLESAVSIKCFINIYLDCFIFITISFFVVVIMHKGALYSL